MAFVFWALSLADFRLGLAIGRHQEENAGQGERVIIAFLHSSYLLQFCQ